MNFGKKTEKKDMQYKKERNALLERIGEVISDSLFILVKWNFYFFITCLPIVTIGPAMAALARCTNLLVKDDEVQYAASRNYFAYFKQAFKMAFVPGLVFMVLNGFFLSGLMLYFKLMQQSIVYIPLVSLSLLAVAIVWAVAVHLFPMLWEQPQHSFSLQVKAAAAAALVNFKGTVAAVLVNALVLVLTVAYFPATLPVVLTVSFSLPAIVAAFSHTKTEKLY